MARFSSVISWFAKVTPRPRCPRLERQLPASLEAAVQAFGTRGRLAIQRLLAAVPAGSRPEILAAVDRAPMTLHPQLLDLEEVGLITVDTPPGSDATAVPCTT